MYRPVEIGKRVPGEVLEKILLEAAEEAGLKATSKDEFRKEYRLGSVHEEQKYVGTEVRLRGKIFPLARITGVRRGYESDWFAISTGLHAAPYVGFCFERQIREYLNIVSQRLQQQK